LAAAVIHVLFYGILQVSRMPLLVCGSLVPMVYPENGEGWHLSYSLGSAGVALGLLLFAVLTPSDLQPVPVSKVNRAIQMSLVVMAAWNCVLATGTLGALTAMTQSGFAAPLSEKVLLIREYRREAEALKERR
jgi:hypothetical protein